ncbi:MAG: glycolate oxidase subunit GlcE [Betaproteobacteria bacterium]|nr:glycolate oxidase subunit GlcE [Betaproteobacteria bacterium]
MPASVTDDQAQQWRAQTQALVAQARDSGRAIQISGHGSKAFYGQPVNASSGDGLTTITTTDYHGIVAYDPSELVVVARAGTSICALESVLAERGQRLAFEPPRFGGKGTVGGMVATGLSGPGRLSAGPCKDFILGLSVMGSDGALMRFGGTVMKNVAGYDVSRLHTGALGILGLILDVSIKVLPEPAARATVTLTCDKAQAVTLCDRWLAEPLPISATAWGLPDYWQSDSPEDGAASFSPSHNEALNAGELGIRFSGAEAAVQSAIDRFEKQHGARLVTPDRADRFWNALRDQRLGFFSAADPNTDRLLWRIAVPAQTPVIPITGPAILEWGGALRWVWSHQPAAEVRAAAQQAGGHATLYLAPDATRAKEGAFAPLPRALQALHQRLKAELDPHHLFNPGRMYAGL